MPVRSAIVIDGGSYEIAPEADTRILAERRVPYFNRTWEHFCSHQHAPDSPDAVGPAAIVNAAGTIAYFANNLFAQYRECGQPLYRDFFRAALAALLPDGLPVETNLPTVARFNLLEQPDERRYVAHLLYAPISLRAQKLIWGSRKPLELIEELLPLHESQLTVQVPHTITGATLVPVGTPLEFTQTGDRVSFTVPEFTGHQMVALNYA